MRLQLTLAIILAFLAATATADERHRVLVLTDIANEPDDEESLVRFMVYCNEFDIEGIVATTSMHLRGRTREDLIRRTVKTYGQVRDNLLLHTPGFPTAESVEAVVATGQTGYGMGAVGEGKSTKGSKLILAAAKKDDPRPLWISVWGGSNTLAQALDDARRDWPEEELKKLVAKLRVYTISDQDDAGRWMRREFPGLFYIVSPSTDWRQYYRSTWSGIAGDRWYKNGPMHKFHLVDNPWLEKNIIKDHGPLGALYPRVSYIMEGDTPSYLGLIENGLCWATRPDYGGWAGRYLMYKPPSETRAIWTDVAASRDTVTADNGQTYTSHQATIWRWREAYQHDFAARMDWCVQPRDKANHNPVVVVNETKGKGLIEIDAKPGEEFTLSAAGSTDPDGDKLSYRWFHYSSAGGSPSWINVKIDDADKQQARLVAPNFRNRPYAAHIILEVKDDGEPCLYAYRRVIVNVKP